MYKDSACAPGSLSLKFLNNSPPILVIEGPCECDEDGPGFQFIAECGDGGHDVSGVAGAADEDEGPVAPVELCGGGSTCSKSALYISISGIA